MKIKSISVKNFRCLQSLDIPCDKLTVLVGRNGVGKSCLLSALGLFYNTDIKVEKADFYDSDTDQDISIAVHFSDLTQREKELLDAYLEGDELVVEKVIKYGEPKPIQKYFGMRHRNADFEDFRRASGTGLRSEYEKLRAKSKYNTLPPYTNRDEAEKALEKWELTNKDKCPRCKDEGQFFGFQNVGTHRLEKFTKFIRIPAVQEASEEGIEEKGSMFERIMEIVVKGSLAASADLAKLEQETQQKYKELIDPSKNQNLKGLEKKLTEALNDYVADSGVRITWIEETGVEISPPRAFVQLREGGYENTIDRCGHGLQRAYILSLFQQLAVIQASVSLEEEKPAGSSKPSLPSLIVGIEEPELYQHPDRQRHFAQTLLKLSGKGIEGAIESIQVIYSTHSPLMIDFQRFNQLRIFKKTKASTKNKPRMAVVTYTDLGQVSRLIEKAKGLTENKIGDEELRQRLVEIMNPWMNEGFFARLAVLVEGIRDRALVLGEATTKGYDFESMGICTIPCSGKNSLTEAIAVYKSLKIPTFVVWDSDKGKPKGLTANRNILSIHGFTPEDYPCKLTDEFCCMKTDLEKTFRDEVNSAEFDRIAGKYCDDEELGKLGYVMENPYMVAKLIGLLKKCGHKSNTLTGIVNKIVARYNALEKD